VREVKNSPGAEEIGKAMSCYSVGSEIGERTGRQPEIMSEEEIVRQNKKDNNCMFSFC
jgi:hypothetical protein